MNLTRSRAEFDEFFQLVVPCWAALTNSVTCLRDGSTLECHLVILLTSAYVIALDLRDGRVQGVALEDGTEFRTAKVASNADCNAFLSISEQQSCSAILKDSHMKRWQRQHRPRWARYALASRASSELTTRTHSLCSGLVT